MSDSPSVLLHTQDFAKQILAAYSLCDEWFRGTLPNDQFDAKDQAIFIADAVRGSADGSPFDCEPGTTPKEIATSSQLRDEFDRAFDYTSAINMAIGEMRQQGFATSHSPFVRAHYFARHWSKFLDKHRGRPPTPYLP